MRVLVYPHTMEIGGCQLNAVETAGALRDRGHDVSVISAPGPLVELVVGNDNVVLQEGGTIGHETDASSIT